MNVNNLKSGCLDPYMDKLALTCLKALTDSRMRETPEDFKKLTARFIKNVIMSNLGA